MTTIAQLVAVISANTAGFDKGVAGVQAGLDRIGTGMASAGSAAGAMGDAVGTASEGAAAKVGLLSGAVADLSRAMDELASNQALLSFGQTVGNVTLGAAAGLAGLALGAAKVASDFGSMTQTIANNTTMTAAQTAQMQTTVMALSRATGQTFEDLAKGYMHVANFGFQAADAQKVLAEANKSAVATGASTEETANILANTLHEFGLKATDAAKAMNVLHDASALGNTTLQQFDESAGVALGVAANFKVGLTDVSAAMTALTQHGYDAARASTQVQDMMVHISAPTPQVIKTLEYLSKKYGVDLVHDFSAAGLAAKGLHGVLDDVQKVIGTNASEVQLLIPALRGGLGAMTLVGTGAKDYAADIRRLNDDMSGKIDPTQKAFNATMATAARQFLILKQRLESDLIPAGQKLLPVITSMLPLFKDVANSLVSVITAFSKLPEPVQKSVLMLGAAKVASSALGINFGGLGGSATKLIGGFAGLKMSGATVIDMFGGMATEGTAAAAGLGLVAAAAVGLGLDIILIRDDWNMAAEAMANYQQAAVQNAATDAARSALNNTGDSKRNIIGEAAKIAFEQGEIKKAIEGRNQALAAVKTDGFAGNSASYVAKIKADIAGLTAAYNVQEKSRRALLADAQNVKYTSHSAAYNSMVDAQVSGDANKGTPATGDANIKNEMAAQEKASKAAQDAAKKLDDLYHSQLESLDKATFLIGKNGKLAEMQADILYGDLGKLTSGEKSRLLTLAAQHDALTQQKKVFDLLQKSADDLVVSGLSKTQQAVIGIAGGYREWLKLSQSVRDQETRDYYFKQRTEDMKDGQKIANGLRMDIIGLGRDTVQALGVQAAGGIETFTRMLNIADGKGRSLADTITSLATVKAFKSGAVDQIKALQEQLWQAGDDAKTATAQLDHFFENLQKQTGASLTSRDAMNSGIGLVVTQAKMLATQIDLAFSSKTISDWRDDLGRDIETARQKIAGTYDPAKAAVADWQAQNQDAIDKIAASGGSIAAVLADVSKKFTLEAQADAAEKFRDMVKDAKSDFMQMTARNPFAAWKQSLGPLPGVDDNQLKKLFDFQEKVQLAKDAASGIRDVIVGAFNDAFQNGAKTFFSSVVTGFDQMLQKMAMDYLSSQLMGLLTRSLGGLFAGGGGGLFGSIAGAASGGIVGTAVSTAAQAAVPSGSSLFSGMSTSVSFAGARAGGGPVLGGMPYLVGEKGPELFVPAMSGGSVIPNGGSTSFGSGENHVYNINVTVPSSGGNREMDRRSGQQIAQAALEEMQRTQRRNGRIR